MADSVKSRRRYDSTLRATRAAETRLTVAAAARDLFLEQGYPAATMDAVAARADVSLKTVYNAFTSKPRLLRAVWDLSLKGDLDQTPVAQRPWYAAVLAEPDPHQQLAILAENSAIIKTRIGPLLKVIRDAAPLDADLAALWELIQTDYWHNQHAIIDSLNAKGALRAELDGDRATDLLWTLNHPDLWLLLVDRRSWTPTQWQAWFTHAATEQLLEPP